MTLSNDQPVIIDAPAPRYDDVAYCTECDGIFPLNSGDICPACTFEKQGLCRRCGTSNLPAGESTCTRCQEFQTRKNAVGLFAALEELDMDFSIGLGRRRTSP